MPGLEKTAVGVHEAKTHLSRLLERVESGESIVITRRGSPVAELGPLTRKPRQPGRLKGRIRMAKDFDAPLPDEVLRTFEGEPE